MSTWLATGVMIVALLLSTTSVLGLTAPQGSAVPKPDGLTLRLPWSPGETHVLGPWRYNGLDPNGSRIAASDHLCNSGGAQDCYALDVVGTDGYPLTTDTEILPLFPGTVIYSGCAYGGSSDTWKNYGQVVYVETVHDGATYGAFYAHLSDRLVNTGETVVTGQPIGHVGSTGKHRDGTVDCGANDPAGNVHLHFAVYRYPQSEIHPETWWLGGPYGGAAVVPEPLTGVQEYQDFATWSGLMTAAAGSSDNSDSAAPPVQWIEPVDGAKVSSSLTVSAWPTPVLVDGQLTDPTDVARVDFTASWSGGSSLACRAKAAGSDGRWSCTADLEQMGVPAGSFELSFDVLRTDDTTLSAPDGVETVTYVRPPTDPMKYLRAGIPKAVRPTCRQASGTLPPATIAALDCKPDAKAIDTMTYFLMRPADARATWQERMAEYGLKAGGNCAKGKAGIQSNKRALSIGCYKNELGYANLRLASSKVCPSVYVGVLGNTKDIATLWKAYDRVAGEGWTDPGFGGRKDAPGCSGRLPAYAPPGPPDDVVATTKDVTTGLDAGMRRACQAAGIALKYGSGSLAAPKCAVTDIRWSPAAGRVDRYIIRYVEDRCRNAVSSYPGSVRILATVGPSARSYRYVTMHGWSTGGTCHRRRIVVEAANAAGGSTAVARWPRSWVP